MTCDTANEEKSEIYKDFITNINPKISPLSNQLDEKLLASKALSEATKESGYDIMLKLLQKDVELFREENIELQSEIATKSQEYTAISGAMTIEKDGEELTLQQAGTYLESLDRNERASVYKLIAERRKKDAPTLNNLFNELTTLRHKVAQNADFQNYRDFAFKDRGRFDYSPKDCFEFHLAIEKAIVPLSNEMAENRREALNVTKLRPWDSKADKQGKAPLKAFDSIDYLVDKSIECFHRIDPFLGECLARMKKMKHLDLDSRKGKAPGGYNYPLMETGVPFIFMNATSTVRDLVTLMHEGGHAVHAILSEELELTAFKNPTPEIAELASMAMELISMEHWDLFFEDKETLKRAKINHLEDVITMLPWIAIVDKFQHWIYENPNHSTEEREAAWLETFNRFSENVTDWSGLEEYKANLWHKQLHIFELPFYYIEYAIAQLGAIAVWRNYKQDKSKALQQYIDALKLGYTQSIDIMYQTAGVKFDFSEKYITELIDFVKEELSLIVKS